MASLGSALPMAMDIDSQLSVMDVGVKFTYQVPAFSVLHVDLKQVEIQLVREDGLVSLYDGFIRADPSLEKITVPFSVCVKDFCHVLVS